ncbi:MAG: uncharacterized membrane protein YhaH (DUF805 family) [Paracoccaceae bacterium]|jgi:uncharacterized membrane protein YhaH (DUF805 family)
MDFSEAVRVCLRKYVTFSGRATRPEYWYFILFVILGGIIFGIFDYILFGGTVETASETTSDSMSASFNAQSNGPLASLFSLAVFLPSLAAGWRRMHDSGRSGLHMFYPMIVMIGVGVFMAFWGGLAELVSGNIEGLIAGVGGIIAILAIVVMILSPLVVLWWLTRPSQSGDNEYGPEA